MNRLIFVSLIVVVLGCQRSTPPPALQPESDEGTAQHELTDFEREVIEITATLVDLKSPEEALKHVRPLMIDTYGETSMGSIMFATWARDNLKWADVRVKKNETTYARVQKDPEAEYGKRLCAWNNIVQIEKANDGLFAGLFLTTAGTLYYFYSVGSTGDIVRMSRSHFCGFVTGKYDYPNSGGGTGHAVQIIGMFDLPENKKSDVKESVTR